MNEYQSQPMYVRIRHYVDNVAQLSRKQIAINMGVTESQVSLILSGKRRLYVDEYERLCKAIAVSPLKFFSPQG